MACGFLLPITNVIDQDFMLAIVLAQTEKLSKKINISARSISESLH